MQDTLTPESHIFITTFEKTIVAKLSGLGTLHNCFNFYNFILNMRDKDYRFIYIDLSECRGMDSTFMGMLVDIYRKYVQLNGNVWVSNPSEYALRQLTLLGISEVIEIRNYSKDNDLKFEDFSVDSTEFETEDWLRFVKQSHENLVTIDSRNKDRFDKFLQTLQQEMTAKK